MRVGSGPFVGFLSDFHMILRTQTNQCAESPTLFCVHVCLCCLLPPSRPRSMCHAHPLRLRARLRVPFSIACSYSDSAYLPLPRTIPWPVFAVSASFCPTFFDT